MRESEAVSILSENIDLKERVIASGIVKDCRKNYKKNGPVYYILPANLVTEIRSYKLLLKQGEEWLFPGKKPGSHKSKNAIFHDIADFSVKIGIKFTSHQFRHTMVVKRRLMGCPDNDNEFLQNAAPVGLQGKVYRERNIDLAHRRDLFDKWNPYQ